MDIRFLTVKEGSTFHLGLLLLGKKRETALSAAFSKITPSLFVDKASCTRQFESKLSLHSLASLFPIKEGFFENLPSIVFTTLSVPLTGDRNLPYLFSKTYPSFLTLKEGSTSHLGLLPSGKKRETALLGAQNRYALRLAGHQSLRIFCGMGPPGCCGGRSNAASKPSPCCAGWDRLGIAVYSLQLIVIVYG